ncbi:MAG TPA: hypothetical protein VGY56_07010 [Verrucomicrobiae bacterium]|nr:hypothetical protein [Verrucomicrobiae bacterium]
MPKPRTHRLYYRNGQLRFEHTELGGKMHGRSRSWHYNGQIAEEAFYDHGQMHGTCRQWDEHGRLLGSFSIGHGTGKHRYWHQNGLLRLEMDLVGGKFHGRLRSWLSDGMLIEESFYIANAEVSRTAYLKAARANPDWPQYADQATGRVAREGTSLERRQFELFIQSLLSKSHAEAHKWFLGARPSTKRSLPAFRTSKAAMRSVEALYMAGAKSVFVVPVYEDKGGNSFADNMVIELPKVSAQRKTLRKLCEPLCRQNQAAILPEKDIGENYLFLSMD